MPNEKIQLLNFKGHAPKLRDTVTDAANGRVLTWDATEKSWYPGEGGASSAPVGAEYVVLAVNASLTNERVLTAGSGITLTDGGAGSTITITIGSGAVSNAMLADSAITISTGDGLTGGGSVSLGSSSGAITVSVDGSTLELSGGSVQVRDGGVTPAKLSFQPRKDSFTGNGGSSVYSLGFRILDADWRDGVVVARNGQVITQVVEAPADDSEYTISDNGSATAITLGSNLATGEKLTALYFA
jgi:hypothetical protein